MRAYLASRGIPVGAKVGKGRTGDLNFEIKDPDGHLVEFVEPQPDGMEAKNAGKFLPATRISDSIYHLGFLVGNSQKSIAFYGDLLGFSEFWRGSSNGKELSWIDMRVPDGQDYVEFMLYSDLPAPNQRGGQDHTSLSVPDLAKAITTLESRPAYKNTPNPSTPIPASTASARSISTIPTALASNSWNPSPPQANPSHPPPPRPRTKRAKKAAAANSPRLHDSRLLRSFYYSSLADFLPASRPSISASTYVTTDNIAAFFLNSTGSTLSSVSASVWCQSK